MRATKRKEKLWYTYVREECKDSEDEFLLKERCHGKWSRPEFGKDLSTRGVDPYCKHRMRSGGYSPCTASAHVSYGPAPNQSDGP